MKAFLRPLWLPFLIISLLTVIAVLASQHASLGWFVHNDRWLRDAIRTSPFASALIAFVLYLVMSLIPGTAGKSIVLGWLFGLVIGVVIVNTALVAAAMVTFLVCRHYLKSVVESRFKFYLDSIRKRMESDGAMYLLTLRLAHAPFSLMNYAAGAVTEVPLWTFWWTTQFGLLPGNLVFVYAGTRLPTLEKLFQSGPLSLLDGPMMLALSGTVLLPWLARRAFRLLPVLRKSGTGIAFSGRREESTPGKKK